MMSQYVEKLNILEQINSIISNIIAEYDPSFTAKKLVSYSNREDLGQFQSNIAFILIKLDEQGKKISPRDIALEIITYLEKFKDFINVNQVNGFINFSLSREFMLKLTGNFLVEKNYQFFKEGKKKIVLDFGGPNVAKSMHVGHLRSSIIGDSLQRIFRFFGHEVVSDIHLGDWGLPIGMIITKLQSDNKNLTDQQIISEITIKQLEVIYPLAAEECKNNPDSRKTAQKITMNLQQGEKLYLEYWRKIIEVSTKSLKTNYDKLDIEFDLWYGESTVNHLIDDLLKKLFKLSIVEKNEGAIIAPTSYESPLILVNSEGGFSYSMTDIATIYHRYLELSAEKIVYVVDKRQSLHFKQVFEVTRKLPELSNLELEHVGFGTLNGKDGKAFKTREGGIMRLEELVSITYEKVLEKIRERRGDTDSENLERTALIIAIGAIKFADLSKYRITDYIFDIDQFTDFHGKTGPYLIYNYIRIKSIIRKSAELGYVAESLEFLPESEVINKLLNYLIKFYFYLEKSYLENSPHYLCEYLHDLSQFFSSFYQEVNILNNQNLEEKSSLISLCKLTELILRKGLFLLGIDVTEVQYM